ncbi:hypothetical protein [Lunatimonas salinarum]|uniref:hypothetical protein n=1 Tax=Lunatimonas salinarum TaxID=1774590 RepID=UPI001AE0C222|nr:hypothetical protein [Lunatimonas salinarum]
MELGVVIIAGIALGFGLIYKSFIHAVDDPETFDVAAMKEKFKKPDGWKVGKLPEDMEKPEKLSKKKQLSLIF